MNILILGGAGFLGNNLIRRCLKEPGHKITVLDSLDARLKSNPDNLKEVLPSIEFIQGDIRDADLMNKIVQGRDVIFNLAGQTSHDLSIEDPSFDTEINCLGNLVVLEAVRKFNKQALLIFTSSSTVVGRAVNAVIDEGHPELPLDIYSVNKAVAEKYYYMYSREHGLNILVLRFANLYGPYGKGSKEFGFMNYFISLAQNNKEISIYGDGKQRRNVMHAEDAVDLLYQCIFHKDIFGDIYFAVSRFHYSVKEIAEEIVSVFGKGKIIYQDYPPQKRSIEVGDVVISGTKLYSRIKWEPKYDLRDGLVKTREVK